MPKLGVFGGETFPVSLSKFVLDNEGTFTTHPSEERNVL